MVFENCQRFMQQKYSICRLFFQIVRLSEPLTFVVDYSSNQQTNCSQFNISGIFFFNFLRRACSVQTSFATSSENEPQFLFVSVQFFVSTSKSITSNANARVQCLCLLSVGLTNSFSN